MTQDEEKSQTEDDETVWPATAFAKQLQKASEQTVEQQTKMFQQLLNSGSGFNMNMNSLPQFGAMSMGTATFKARVQSGGRISIPDAEREALDIQEGDVVQTVVIPIKKNRGEKNE